MNFHTFPPLLSDLIKIWYEKSVCNAVEHFVSFMKIATGKATLFLGQRCNYIYLETV